MLVFPLVFPDSIKSLETPDYKTSSNSWKSGDKLFKRTQFTGVGTKLNLEYLMMSQSNLDEINLLWDTSVGVLVFTLPDIFYSKYPTSFKNAVSRLKSNTYWIIDSPPAPIPKILCGNSVTRTNRYDLNLTITSQIA